MNNSRDSIKSKLLQYAYGILVSRDLPYKTVQDKLKKKCANYSDLEFSAEDLVQEIMSELVIAKYVDDFRYATSFINSKYSSTQPIGMSKIKQQLRLKGINSDVISQAFDLIEDAIPNDALRFLIQKRTKGKTLDYEQKQKLYKYLMSRGFSFSAIQREVDSITLLK
ncbi:MAG: regulatory protein RecX [Patescibacteria group bacterium]|uniref:Regulatory protein RecX n=1 Tax=candidate division WWE3 bacterium TaxID=2053526 RepID=A0A955EBK1_UNCKA|nr:RecX family transcriptional regulator [candidate division WWE3 bacterium]